MGWEYHLLTDGPGREASCPDHHKKKKSDDEIHAAVVDVVDGGGGDGDDGDYAFGFRPKWESCHAKKKCPCLVDDPLNAIGDQDLDHCGHGFPYCLCRRSQDLSWICLWIKDVIFVTWIVCLDLISLLPISVAQNQSIL